MDSQEPECFCFAVFRRSFCILDAHQNGLIIEQFFLLCPTQNFQRQNDQCQNTVYDSSVFTGDPSDTEMCFKFQRFLLVSSSRSEIKKIYYETLLDSHTFFWFNLISSLVPRWTTQACVRLAVSPLESMSESRMTLEFPDLFGVTLWIHQY